MEEAIKKILEITVHAPSGENCQPWRFEIEGNRVHIHNLPERDNSLYSWGQRASFVAHGALIENMLIAASALGYRADPHVFPDKQDGNFVATVVFEKTTPQNEPLYPFIVKRATNRKPYKPVSLTAQQREELSRNEKDDSAQLLLTEDKETIKKLAAAAAVNEEILFGNKQMHHFFFSHINWTEEEEKEKRMGFYTKELELNSQQLGAFKLFRHWPIMKVFNIFGVAKFIAKENAKTYASASAIGAVVTDGNSQTDFLNAGRVFQRAWLKTTAIGMSFQPLTGILFLMHRIKADQAGDLSPAHVQLVKNNYEVMRGAFNVSENKTIAMMFRIGDGGEPSARALRLPPDITYKS